MHAPPTTIISELKCHINIRTYLESRIVFGAIFIMQQQPTLREAFARVAEDLRAFGTASGLAGDDSQLRCECVP